MQDGGKITEGLEIDYILLIEGNALPPSQLPRGPLAARRVYQIAIIAVGSYAMHLLPSKG